MSILNIKNLVAILTMILGVVSISGQPLVKSEAGPFLLKGGTIHTVSNGTQSGDILISNGIIQQMGNSIELPSNTKMLDCSGLHIYPGMIDAGTTLGLSEVGSVSLTQDANEIGELTPHVKALTAVNPNSTLIPVTRVSGVTTVLTMPQGGQFPGTASLINLHGYTPTQMYAGFDAILMNYPSSGRRSRFDRRSEEDIKKAEEKSLKAINEAWDQAEVYHRVAGNQKNNIIYNPEMEALSNVIAGNAMLLIEVNSEKDILSAIKWTNKRNLKAVFTGVAEGWRVADSLVKANIPVITGPMFSTPRRSSNRYDAAYANAGLMAKAGVKVAIRSMESENVRNLPYNAGFAAAYGMGPDEALRAITLTPAEIFGVQDKLGSIDKGKIANLFVSDGDPFETKTNVQHVFINGWKIPMDSRHIRLYNEFLERSPGLEKE